MVGVVPLTIVDVLLMIIEDVVLVAPIELVLQRVELPVSEPKLKVHLDVTNYDVVITISSSLLPDVEKT